MAKKAKPTRRTPAKAADRLPDSTPLLADLRQLFEAARAAVARAVNPVPVLPYWRQVGIPIRADVRRDRRWIRGWPSSTASAT